MHVQVESSIESFSFLEQSLFPIRFRAIFLAPVT